MSSKSETLGASSSFARAGQARSLRRQLTDAALGGDPSELPLHVISANPDNPRENIGDVSGMASSLLEIGQIQAITVASVEAYLRDRPERARELDTGAQYVVVDGHRRLAGAREAGLPSIKVTIDDTRVSTDEALLEAAFVANAQRENLSDLEEAQALQTLVEFYGSQHKAAKRLGVTQPYISQRLSLLALAPDLQADLQAGLRKVEHVRGMAKLSPQEQRATANARAAQAEEKRQAKATQRRESAVAGGPAGENDAITRGGADLASGRSDNDVITSGGEAGTPPGDNGVIAASGPAAARAQDSDNDVISRRPTDGSASAGGTRTAPDEAVRLPWDSPQALNQLVRRHMSDEDRITLAKLLAED
ncbi:ParB/RepB/Spo0J family partition protein [Streptomyces sp. NPDC002133]|uniref:ParB/RepB/Spo0J family partition protein n=1 Tax=Streptomyces sp. NPDC002133 TaxID=3154409 RepID=UPI0033177F3C